MATILTDNAHYAAIASAIRSKANASSTYMPSEMASAILALEVTELGSNAADVFAYGRPYLSRASGSAPYIDYRAFVRCDNLENANFPNASYVGSEAFSGCPALSVVNLASCDTISDGAFSGCLSLAYISAPSCTYVGQSAFLGCTMLPSFTMPLIESIGAYAFDGCTSLSVLTLPSCAIIGDHAFRSCCVSSLSLPMCETVGSYAFQSCKSLVSVNLPAVKTINAYAFGSCTSLTSVSAPYVTTIGANAFAGCVGLTTMSLSTALTVGGGAFAGCTNLSAIDIGLVASIPASVFNGCVALSSLVAYNASTVDASALYGCTNLSVVRLLGCTRVGSSAFANCTDLMELWLLTSSVATLSNVNAFYSTPMSVSAYTGSFGSIYVPASLWSSYRTVAKWSTYSSRFASVTVSPSSPVVPISMPQELFEPVGTTLTSLSGSDGTFDLDVEVTTSKSLYEGFNVRIDGLPLLELCELSFDLTMPDTSFLGTNQMRFGLYTEPDATYNASTVPYVIERVATTQHLSFFFAPRMTDLYLRFALSGLADSQTVDFQIRNLRVRTPQFE